MTEALSDCQHCVMMSVASQRISHGAGAGDTQRLGRALGKAKDGFHPSRVDTSACPQDLLLNRGRRPRTESVLTDGTASVTEPEVYPSTHGMSMRGYQEASKQMKPLYPNPEPPGCFNVQCHTILPAARQLHHTTYLPWGCPSSQGRHAAVFSKDLPPSWMLSTMLIYWLRGW